MMVVFWEVKKSLMGRQARARNCEKISDYKNRFGQTGSDISLRAAVRKVIFEKLKPNIILRHPFC
jgi:hypothetical protein